jgi:phage terminase small subunit
MKLTNAQSKFVVAYVDNELAGGKLSGTEIAVSVGYSPKTAFERAPALLAMPSIQEAIAERKTWLAENAAGPEIESKRVLREWTQIALGDPTEIVSVRRPNCRHCWGVGYAYQWLDGEYAEGTAEAMRLGDTLDRFKGGPGFRQLRDPNPDCPECAGEGVEDLHVKDFRKLTDAQRRLIAGVKYGKHGLEVSYRDQDAALLNLARFLGLVVNKNEHGGPNGGPIPVASVNYTLPSDPVEAAKAYQMLMEGKTK